MQGYGSDRRGAIGLLQDCCLGGAYSTQWSVSHGGSQLAETSMKSGISAHTNATNHK